MTDFGLFPDIRATSAPPDFRKDNPAPFSTSHPPLESLPMDASTLPRAGEPDGSARPAAPLEPAPPARPSLFYRVCHVIIRNLCRAYFRWEVSGVENMPRTGGVLLAANHLSYLDPPLLGAAIPREIHFLARKTLFQPPWMARLIRSLNAVPLDRDGGGGAGLRTVLDLLRDGQVLLLFPEGTRSADGHLQPARPGVGLTVLKSDAKVIPVAILGTYEAYGRGHRFPKPCKVRIRFGREVALEDLRQECLAGDRLRTKEAYQKAAHRIMTQIAALMEPDGAVRQPRPVPDPLP
jgi:1-acyl-sn-glycerol-3-phosphate acyltransferase